MKLKWRLRKLISFIFIFCLVSQTVLASPVKQQGQGVHPQFKSLEFNGQAYQYYERKTKSGRVIGQYLIGKDRTEIMLDNNGDGQLDSWEIFTKSGKMLMSGPHRGHFQQMDLEVMTKKGVTHYAYSWSRTRKLYSLYSVKSRPYLKYAYTSEFIVGCLGGAGGEKLEDLAQQLNTALNEGNLSSELAANLKSQAMDSSCRTGDFAKSADSMVAGMMAVASSEKDGGWKEKSADDSARPVERGMYLQCMRHMGLFAQASRIESAMAQYTSLVPENKYLWRLTCSTKPTAEYGNFIEAQANIPPTVEIHATRDQVKTFLKNPSATEEQIQAGYGRIFFHEMLHYSMMSENDAHLVENCCAEPTEGTAKEAACDKAELRAQETLYKQGYQNLISESLGADGLAVLHDTLSQSFGDNDAEDYYNDTLSLLGQTYAKYALSKTCQASATKDAPLGSCDKDYQAEVGKIIEARFGAEKGSVCRSSVDPKIAAAEAAKICGYTAGILQSIINKKGPPCGATIRQSEGKESKTSAALELFRYFVRPEIATADSIDVSGSASDRLCSVAKNMIIENGTIDNLGATTNFDASVPQPLIAGIQSANEKTPGSLFQGSVVNPANPTTTNAAIKPTTASGKTSYDVNSGPARPIFSNDSTTRSKEIANHIANSDSLIKNFQSYANKTADAILPKAQAEPSNLKTTDISTNYRPLPKISVPDPLGSLGANGPGGISLPSRAPASIAGRGAESAADSGAGKTGVGRGVASLGAKGRGRLGGLGGADGASDPNGAKANQTAKKSVNPAEERALKALLLFLKNKDYENKVKPELGRPSVQAALLDHKVQVVDEDGKVFGSGFPVATLIYDQGKRSLVDAPAKAGAK